MRNSLLAHAVMMAAVGSLSQPTPRDLEAAARRRAQYEREDAEAEARHQSAIAEAKRKIAAATAKRERKATKRAARPLQGEK